MSAQLEWYNTPLAMLAGVFVVRWAMYRNLLLGLGLLLSMIAGGFLGLFCLTNPIRSSTTPEGDAYELSRNIVIGTILGGVAWKLWQWWNMRRQPPSNS